jgi:hypothetical protein
MASAELSRRGYAAVCDRYCATLVDSDGRHFVVERGDFSTATMLSLEDGKSVEVNLDGAVLALTVSGAPS